MNGILIGAGAVMILLTFVLYCCVRVGAQADRRLEELEWKDRQDADRKDG